jgi:predicted tellurium resistance membrane protein TerC
VWESELMLFSADFWIALITLTVLEIVLGIDNIIFISILSGRLPASERNKARLLGLILAMFMRIGLLFSINWITKLTHPLFEIFSHAISGRDLILILGGLFLLAKSTHEIHIKLEGEDESEHAAARKVSFMAVIVQIMFLDIVFSLDSVITAVGMSNNIVVMVLAVVFAVLVMMVFSGRISNFVHEHPTLKILALSFLILIGVSLIADGFHQHIPKGYIYFSMAFSVFVEMINLKVRARKKPPIELRSPVREFSKN